MKLLFISVLFVSVISSVCAQTNKVLTEPIYFPSSPGLTVIHKTIINWSPKPLTWANYREISDTTVIKNISAKKINAKAATTTAITASFQCLGHELHYEVRALFSIKQSWLLKGSKGDSSLLRHEQIHFNITELYARKIRKLLAEYKKPCGKENEVQVIIDSLKRAEINENNLYDIESVHNTNKKMQKKWELKIKNDLIKTQAYINPIGKINYNP